MATKKRATASAPASEKPVQKRGRRPLAPGETHDGRPSHAENSARNKATKAAALKDVRAIVQDIKTNGKSIAAPFIAELVGQPVEWSLQLEEALYALISTGHGMSAISKMDGMPSLYRMLRWLGDDTHPFKDCHARAKQSLVPLYEEMAQSIAMNPNLTVTRIEKQVLTKDGDLVDVVETRHADNVERSRLAVDTMRWSLGHLKPKKHGRAPDLEGGGPNEQLEGLFAALKAGPKS